MIEPYTESWYELRKTHIGASDSNIIMGVSPWRTREELLHEKVGLIPPQAENYYMRRGKEKETEALGVFENELKKTLMIPKVYFHSQIHYMFCSVDGVDYEEKVFVEIKCPGKKDHQIALDGKIPDKYYPQLQHIIEVVGCNSAYYFSYHSVNSWKIILVEKDQDFIKNLKEQLEIFHKELMDLHSRIS